VIGVICGCLASPRDLACLASSCKAFRDVVRSERLTVQISDSLSFNELSAKDSAFPVATPEQIHRRVSSIVCSLPSAPLKQKVGLMAIQMVRESAIAYREGILLVKNSCTCGPLLCVLLAWAVEISFADSILTICIT
jgi:hypothetical protein